MLTTMFYSDVWRPYLLRDSDTAVSSKKNAGRNIRQSLFEKQAPILLNKTLSKDSMGFAQDVYRSVVSLKEASRVTLLADARFARRSNMYGEDAAKEYVVYGLSDFAKAYNTASGFLPLQDQAPDLINFFDKTSNAVTDGTVALTKIGLTREGGGFKFSGEKLSQMSGNEAKAAIDSARPYIESIYDSALDVMKKPLTAHMEFRSFRYYYNYQTGVTKKDTFTALGTGTMVDLAL